MAKEIGSSFVPDDTHHIATLNALLTKMTYTRSKETASIMAGIDNDLDTNLQRLGIFASYNDDDVVFEGTFDALFTYFSRTNTPNETEEIEEINEFKADILNDFEGERFHEQTKYLLKLAESQEFGKH